MSSSRCRAPRSSFQEPGVFMSSMLEPLPPNVKYPSRLDGISHPLAESDHPESITPPRLKSITLHITSSGEGWHEDGRELYYINIVHRDIAFTSVCCFFGVGFRVTVSPGFVLRLVECFFRVSVGFASHRLAPKPNDWKEPILQSQIVPHAVMPIFTRSLSPEALFHGQEPLLGPHLTTQIHQEPFIRSDPPARGWPALFSLGFLDPPPSEGWPTLCCWLSVSRSWSSCLLCWGGWLCHVGFSTPTFGATDSGDWLTPQTKPWFSIGTTHVQGVYGFLWKLPPPKIRQIIIVVPI